MPPERRDFADSQALAEALATRIADRLRRVMAEEGAASLAVSGGSTPVRFLAALGRQRIDWNGVHVTLVDERWVGEDDPRSNAALVRRELLAGPASPAHFTPLHTDSPDPESGIEHVRAAFARLPRPFAAVVLGMGEDGHTASWFAGGDNLEAASDPGCTEDIVAMGAPGAGESRITLTLPAVLDTRALCLHIEGEAKRAALDAALAPGPIAEMPVRAILRQTSVPLEIYWCP